MKPNILITIPKGKIFDSFFDENLIHDLNEIGNTKWNDTEKQYTEEELVNKINDIDIVMTGWGSINFSDKVLESAKKLKLIVHNGGTVRPMIDENVFKRGIRVCSGNKIFAKSVSEGVLAYMLFGLRKVPNYLDDVKKGCWPDLIGTNGLFYKKVGLIGFGEITVNLVKLLKVFNCEIYVSSKYVTKEDLDSLGIKVVSKDYIFENCDVISLHQSLRNDNYQSIKAEHFEKIKYGALFINTARGEIVNEDDFIKVFSKRKDLKAILDVYNEEPLPLNSNIRKLSNVYLMPHVAGPTEDMRKETTKALILDIKNFVNGRMLEHEINSYRISYMTTRIK